MLTYFISDLHLSEQRPDIIRAFIEFIEQQAPQADALYILGDLFEFWIGDDDQTPVALQVEQALLALAEQGVPTYFIHGNRDFMVGKDYARRCRMILLEEEEVIDLYGKKVLILHGDTLCTDDQGYQEYRAITQKRWLRRLFLLLPLFIRQILANKIRSKSKQANKSKSLGIMDVNQGEVEQRFKQRQIDYMIHGHTHRPDIHQIKLGTTSTMYRVVLGDWYQQMSVLRIDSHGLDLSSAQQHQQLKLD
ncbi:MULTISPECIES: UDP-2,3-diacylglucosamine diphosphatase [unclassified Agarivorans]|uniref:UDP-2,3-diacylglucosamine diphosphatase n=1 Tax=unclassified Agarivorans TaxID=2636026 RepID=UPI003D7E48A5